MENQAQTSEQALPQKPEDVNQLEQTLNDMNRYRSAVQKGMFTGAESNTVRDLIQFLTQLYKQVWDTYVAHPFIVEQKRKAQEVIAAQSAQKSEENATQS